MTKTQFGRVLHFLSLNVGAEDLKLIVRKFEDPASGDVNYPAFVQAVDQGKIIFMELNFCLIETNRQAQLCTVTTMYIHCWLSSWT